MKPKSAVLLVANWDSGVGYAWWLMESFWAKLAERYSSTERVILAFPSISTLSNQIAEAPLEPVELHMGRGGVRGLIQQFTFLQRNEVRLIYFSDWSTWSWRYLVYRAAGVKKIIVHDHTPGMRTPPQGTKRLIKLVINRLPGISADGAIGATEFVRQRIIATTCFPPAKTFAAPNGLPADQHPNLAAQDKAYRVEFNIPHHRKVLVMTSRANRYKNVDFAIKCLAELVNEGRDDLHFLFVGDGPHLRHFQHTAAQLGVSGHCTFPGSRSDVAKLLQCCHFAIHPSKGEVGYSLSVLEYMRAGLPVLVPDNPSVCAATIPGETGLVYPEGDIRAAAQFLRVLLDSPGEAERMGRLGREKVLRDYSLQSTHRGLYHAFERLDPE